MLGRAVKDPPPALIIARLLKAFPGYTAKTLLEEDVEVVQDLLAVENAEAQVSAAKRKFGG